MKQQSFGRRTTHQTSSPATKTPAVSHAEHYSKGADALQHVGIELKIREDRSLEDELDQWKRDRRKAFRLPWRQISFMASACFGIGSFVLPESVNHAVQWLLMALGALSLIASFSARRKLRS
jgi:hypothetical protein